MSVLDRAIVKAYALQKNSAPPAPGVRAPVRVSDLSQPITNAEAALNATDEAARLLAQDVDRHVETVSAAEWDSLTSLSTVSAPQPDSELRIDCGQATSDSESADVQCEALTPPAEIAQTPHYEVAAAAESGSNASTATLAPPEVSAPTATVASTPVQVPVRATEVAWEWPEICEQLDQFTGDGFRQLAKHLQVAASQGHKVLAFVGTTPNTGRTSVVLTLTRILALEERTHALLIDADRRHPELARLTGLNPAVGLSEVLHGQATLDQTSTPRTPGLVSLLPLRTSVSDAEWGKVVSPLRALVKRARQEYDLVLIDAGVFGTDTRLSDCWLRGAADAVITISRQLTGSKTAHDVLNWKQIGIESLGVIETFS